MKQFKSAILVTGLQRGGAEKVASVIFNNLQHKGFYLITFLRLNETDYKLYNYSRVILIDNFNTKNKLIRFFKDLKDLRKVIKDQNFKTVISLLPNTNLRLIISSFFVKVKTIISVRNDPNKFKKDNIIYYIFTFILYRFANIIVFQNNYQMKFYKFKNVFRTVIPNPIELPTNVKFILRKSIKKLVYVGRLEKQKNPFFLIKLISELIKIKKIELHIYGQGSLKNKLLEYQKALGVQNNVFYHDISLDIFKEFTKYDLFVFSSLYEGFPNTLIEAMSVGCPIITTPFAGGFLEDYCKNLENIFISSFDVKLFANSILNEVYNENNRKKVSTNSIKLIQQFSSKDICKKWYKILSH